LRSRSQTQATGWLEELQGTNQTQEEVIPLVALKECVNKTAHAYTDEHAGLKKGTGTRKITSHIYTSRDQLTIIISFDIFVF
jgi:hypothetical protein